MRRWVLLVCAVLLLAGCSAAKPRATNVGPSATTPTTTTGGSPTTVTTTTTTQPGGATGAIYGTIKSADGNAVKTATVTLGPLDRNDAADEHGGYRFDA